MKSEEIRERMGVTPEKIIKRGAIGFGVLVVLAATLSIGTSGLVIWLIFEAIQWLKANS